VRQECGGTEGSRAVPTRRSEAAGAGGPNCRCAFLFICHVIPSRPSKWVTKIDRRGLTSWPRSPRRLIYRWEACILNVGIMIVVLEESIPSYYQISIIISITNLIQKAHVESIYTTVTPNKRVSTSSCRCSMS
jgi:hypothetical protein